MPYAGVTGLATGYREAEEALLIGQELLGGDRTTYFGDLGIRRLLFPLRDSPELRAFYAEYLGALESYDERHGTELIRTLEGFFTHHGNHVRAAEALHLHRNTLLYRLARLQAISGLDLDDAEVRLAAQVALRLRPLAAARRPGGAVDALAAAEPPTPDARRPIDGSGQGNGHDTRKLTAGWGFPPRWAWIARRVTRMAGGKVVNQDLKREVLASAEKADIKFVNLQFTDIMGVVKNVTIPVHKFDDAVEHGLWFDGSSIEGFARIAESDMYLVPDLRTFAVDPLGATANPTARVICDVYTPDGEPFAGDPRDVLRRADARGRTAGLHVPDRPGAGVLPLRAPTRPGKIESLPHDQAGYFDVTTDVAADVRKEMVNALEALGITVEASHHEVAIGQHEIDFRYGDALRTADNAVTFKVDAQGDRPAARPATPPSCPSRFFGINGSGMHIHQSLADAATGKKPVSRPGRRVRPVARLRQAVHRRAAGARARHGAPSWRRWSTRTSAWCRATKRRSTSAGRASTARR